MSKPTIQITVIDDENDEEFETQVPAKYEVCPRCEGRGKHVNPSVDGHGISREEFDADPGFFEDYMSGVFDVACHSCNGARVKAVADYEKMTAEEKKWYDDHIQRQHQMEEEIAAERRMGA